jgi:hypothetical protein
VSARWAASGNVLPRSSADAYGGMLDQTGAVTTSHRAGRALARRSVFRRELIGKLPGVIAKPRARKQLSQGPQASLGRFGRRSKSRHVHHHRHRAEMHQCGPANVLYLLDAKHDLCRLVQALLVGCAVDSPCAARPPAIVVYQTYRLFSRSQRIGMSRLANISPSKNRATADASPGGYYSCSGSRSR